MTQWSSQQQAFFRWFERPSGHLVGRARAGCLAGDTRLNINRAGKGSPMTIEKVVGQLYGEPPLFYRSDLGCFQRMRPWDLRIETRIARVDDGRVRLGVISDAWCSGLKTTYTLTTDTGRSIRATAEHPFLLENGQWSPLGDLTLGAQVCVNVGQGGTEYARKLQYSQTSTKYHPHQVANGRRRWKVATHRLVVEAEMNNLVFSEYVGILQTHEDIARRLLFLPVTSLVHHKDGDELNNDQSNLLILNNVHDHAEQHDWGVNVLARIGSETVVSIEQYGEEITYDVAVQDDPHCFLANGFVVHNTGKTTTIIEAVARIMPLPSGELPRVLVCAFNKRIGDELKRKLSGSGADAKTLHALGFMFLKGAWGNDIRVDTDVEDARIEATVQRLHPGDDAPSWEAVTAIKKLIGIAKGSTPFGTVEELLDLAIVKGCEVDDPAYDTDWIATVAHGAMNAAKTPDDYGRITFDDMLYVPVVNGYAVPLYDWVIVDEAQDMNPSQLKLAREACKPDGHMVVIGDDRQAIYGFRGADSGAIDRLKHELQATELALTTTYRCGKEIVAVAAKLVPDFEASEGAHAGEVTACEFDEVTTLVEPGDVILSRTNAPLVPLCLRLIRDGVAAKVEGRDIGKALAARAKKLRATSVEDFLTKLSRWARTASGRAIARGRQVDQKLAEIRDIEATLAALTEDATSVEDIFRRCELMFGDVAMENNSKDATACATAPTALVILSTVHKAKGLEWNRVFLIAASLYCNGQRREDPEEANIEYVAITRARETLVMVR
jgi:hypothetical protein